MALSLKPLPCYPEPHVHIEGHGISQQFTVGRDFDGHNGYRQRLQLTWHGIAEFPMEEHFEYLPEGKAIARRLEQYVGGR